MVKENFLQEDEFGQEGLSCTCGKSLFPADGDFEIYKSDVSMNTLLQLQLSNRESRCKIGCSLLVGQQPHQ